MHGKRFRFLIDVDEVLGSFQQLVLQTYEDLFGKKLSAEDYVEWDVFSLMSESERRQVSAEIEKPGWCAAIEPIEGSFEAVEQLRRVADVVVVTSPYSTSPTWVYERGKWLEQHFGFTRDQVIYASSKAYVKGDAFLDDNPRQVASWAKEHPDGLAMLWHLPNTRNIPHAGVRVHSWDDVLKLVHNK